MPSEPLPTSAELPLDYYHRNFCQLLRVVEQRYADLLNLQEKRFLQQFRAASPAAQCLYVRLSGRSKSLFRLSKLQYQEIPSLLHAAHELASHDLLCIDPALEMAQLISLYTKAELITLLRLDGAHKLKRAALEQQLIDEVAPQTMQALAAADTVLAVLQEEHLPVFKLCFFGNLHQDLNEFVLSDLAIFSYERYSLDNQSRQFNDRQQLEQHLQYYACSSLAEDLNTLSSDDIYALSEHLPHPAPDDHVLHRRVSRLRNRLARQLERLRQPQQALQLYSQSNDPPARERCARIKMAAGDIEQSLALCEEILQNPLNEAEAVFAQQFGQRHAKRHGLSWPMDTPIKPPERHVQLPQTQYVEADLAALLSAQGACYFVENTLFSSVLGLALWPAVFAPVKGAFSHPFQQRPHDFYHPDFYAQRAQLIDAALEHQCSDPHAFRENLLQTFNTKHGLSNPLVFWSHLDEQLLRKALAEIPVAHWQAIFRRLLADLRNHRNGLPDLIHFPTAGGYELVEVKGPGDRLQDNQKRWMAFFQQHDIPHWVAYVSWQSSPKDV